MQKSRKRMLAAVAMIAGGVAAFFAVLALMGIDPDERPLGLFEWMMGGALIGPGFGYLIKWRRQDSARDARSRWDRT